MFVCFTRARARDNTPAAPLAELCVCSIVENNNNQTDARQAYVHARTCVQPKPRGAAAAAAAAIIAREEVSGTGIYYIQSCRAL